MPEDMETRIAPLAATQTYDQCDPVYLVANALTEADQDGSEVLVAECIGMAAEPALGTTAASRATNVADGFGAVTNSNRTYWHVHANGIQYRTRNFYGTGAAAAGTLAVPDAANIGVSYQVACSTAGQWGLEETAVTPGTEVLGNVIEVLDANLQPIGETGAAGVWVVFTISGSTLTQDLL